jgi:TPR repeat protein
MESKYYKQALRLARSEKNDDEKVFALLSKAFGEGDPRAAYAIGSWFLIGKHVKKNYKTAVQYIELAAEHGVPEAQFDLAVACERGTGTKKNAKRAFTNYLKAALSGDPQAVYEVGRCYYSGIGVGKNKEIAGIWINKAREMGVE